MELIGKKLRMDNARGMELWKKRVFDLLDSQFAQHRIIYLSGTDGGGRASAVHGYLEKRFANEYGYLKLDGYDNQERRFLNYLEEMVKASKARLAEACHGEEEFGELLPRLITGLQNTGWENVLVFDRLEYLEDERVIEELALFLDYLPENCRVVLMESRCRRDGLAARLLGGRMKWLPAKGLWMTEEEIRSFFEEKGLSITQGQAREIQRQTGGMPGAVEIIISQLQDMDARIEKMQVWHSPALDLFFEKNIWDVCGEDEKQIFLRGAGFPYVTEEFCSLVLGIRADKWMLYRLEREGLLLYDQYNSYYTMPDFMKGYLERSLYKPEGECGHERYKKAAEWFDARGDVRETIKNVLILGDGGLLEENLGRHAKEIPAILGEAELRKCLEKADAGSENPFILYLFGVLAIWEEDEGGYKEVWVKLEEQYREMPKDRQRLGEILLNLLYEDPEVSIEAWLDKAEVYAREIEPIAIYSITSGLPSIRNGKKDLTPLFIHGVKEERKYRKRWERLVKKEQAGLMALASIDYLLETDREKQAIQELRELMPELGKSEDVQQMLGMAGVLCRLIQKEEHGNYYGDILSRFLGTVRGSRYALAAQNLNALYDYSYACGHKKDGLAHWILYDASHHSGRITRENAYISLIKAKGLYMIGQYAKAQILFAMLNDFYERKGTVQFQAESLFGEAAALYEQGERGVALKKATQAITLGLSGRYIGIFTDYGRTGAGLIEAYQELTGNTGNVGVTKKKKYYYGNVLRASFEEYQSMLLRSAKRRRNQGLEPAPREERADTLTMTEAAILQYINGGCSNQEISRKMNIKISTVKTHIYHIYRKLGVSGRVAAINRGKELNLL